MLSSLRRLLSLRMPNPTGKNGYTAACTAVPLSRSVIRRHENPKTEVVCEEFEVTQVVARLGRRWRVRMVEYCPECGWREERRIPEET